MPGVCAYLADSLEDAPEAVQKGKLKPRTETVTRVRLE